MLLSVAALPDLVGTFCACPPLAPALAVSVPHTAASSLAPATTAGEGGGGERATRESSKGEARRLLLLPLRLSTYSRGFFGTCNTPKRGDRQVGLVSERGGSCFVVHFHRLLPLPLRLFYIQPRLFRHLQQAGEGGGRGQRGNRQKRRRAACSRSLCACSTSAYALRGTCCSSKTLPFLSESRQHTAAGPFHICKGT